MRPPRQPDHAVSFARFFAIAVGLVFALPLGCEEDPFECPAGWARAEVGSTPCIPPDAHVADVDARLGTAFYGYATLLRLVPTDEDTSLAQNDELARNTTLEVIVRDPNGPYTEFETLWIDTDADGLFELAADPAKTYVFETTDAGQPKKLELTLVHAYVATDECPL